MQIQQKNRDINFGLIEIRPKQFQRLQMMKSLNRAFFFCVQQRFRAKKKRQKNLFFMII